MYVCHRTPGRLQVAIQTKWTLEDERSSFEVWRFFTFEGINLRDVHGNALCSGKLECLLSPALVAENTVALILLVVGKIFLLLTNNIVFPSLILFSYPLAPSLTFFNPFYVILWKIEQMFKPWRQIIKQMSKASLCTSVHRNKRMAKNDINH